MNIRNKEKELRTPRDRLEDIFVRVFGPCCAAGHSWLPCRGRVAGGRPSYQWDGLV